MRAAPHRRQNRLLAIAMAVESVSLAFSFGFGYMTTDRDVAIGFQSVNTILFLALPAAYFAFLGTLDTPLAAPFRRPAGLVPLGILTAGLEILFFTRRDLFFTDFVHTANAPWDYVPGPAFVLYQTSIVGTLAYSLIVTISAWRRAPAGSVARKRAKAYAAAYVTRDALLIIVLVVLALNPSIESDAAASSKFSLFIPFVSLVGSSMLAYGILKTQLFDIDLKIKVGIERSTVVTIVAATSLVTGKIVDHYATEEYGWYAAIGVAIGMMFFAKALERVGHRVADKALPRVQPTSSYVAYKKLEVYRSAVESALENDGVIDERERSILDRLRGSLEIGPDDAAALEADVARKMGAQLLPSADAARA